MNRFQRGNSHTSLSPPSNYSIASAGEDEKKSQEGKTPDEGKPSGGLELYFESKNSKSRFEWGVRSERKKFLKDATRKAPAEEKRKKREGKKNHKPLKSLDLLQNQIMKLKKEASSKSHIISEISGLKSENSSEISFKRKESENLKAPVNNLFTARKENLNQGKKSDVVIKLAQEQKLAVKPEPSETNTQSLEGGKKKINDILKMHAQKFQVCSAKSSQHLRDSLQGVTEMLKKVQNISNKERVNVKEPGGTDVKKEKKTETRAEEIKTKSTGSKEKSSCKESASIIILSQSNSEEKKKAPQSNEQEKNSTFAERKTKAWLITEKNAEESEEEKSTKKVNSPKDDTKHWRKTTYTDRLIIMRMLGKDDENKLGSSGESERKAKKEVKVESSEKSDSVSRFLYFQPKQKSQTSLSSKEDLSKMKDTCSPSKEVEQIIKTKASRSTELRDLVTQAIKEHKIFCIFDNHSYIVRPVREELLGRGWLEVIPDRRLIPRRRPPPMGPTTDREKMNFDRNCNTIEAILTAKEAFADEIEESVSRSTSFRIAIDGLKPPNSLSSNVSKKSSQESLNETLSLFRIIPPTPEKKKNNVEIREFVCKYGPILDKDLPKIKDKKPKEKERLTKSAKTPRTTQIVDLKTPKSKAEDKRESFDDFHRVPSHNSFQSAIDAVLSDKKNLIQELTDNKFSNANNNSTVKALTEGKHEQESQEHGKKMGTSKTIYTESETKTISKIIQSMNTRIHFMWLSIKPSIHLKCFNYSPEIINKFQKTSFCTKIGLWSHLNNIQWYAHEVHFPAKSPRMYNTGEADDLQAFFQDFQMTACMGMLKWLAESFFDKGMKAVQTKKGKVPLKAFEFAIKQCEKYIKFKDNEDLSVPEEQKSLQEDWNNFLQWYYIITNDHGKIQESSSAQLMVVYTKAVETLKLMKRYWPEIDIDGRLNIWIMKPYCASCGRGIFMTNNVYYIGQHSKYIVQKYIEKPLLIYNTKFDIRQWFMITKLTPLEIWMYKECYLRFCTQPFALRNLHESVHLSNNSVQRKYINVRDASIPDQNMWDSKTFQLYLRTIGHPNAWEEVIYPGMKDAIISTMLAAQDTFDCPRKSWFEVYGADFMISANVKDGPWLIEINENPAMDPSTKVTARLCPQMLRDVIKVVVDKRANKNASTGEWELIYRQNYSPSFGSVDLDVKGKKISRVPYTAKTAVTEVTPPSILKNSNNLQQEKPSDSPGSKAYEIVKSLGAVSNSRGDASYKKNSNEKVKTLKSSEKVSIQLMYHEKYDSKPNLQSLILMDTRPQSKEKQENMAHKIIAKTAELSRIVQSESKGSKKNEKKLSSVVSTGRMKKMRCSGKETKGNFTSDSLFPGGEKFRQSTKTYTQ